MHGQLSPRGSMSRLVIVSNRVPAVKGGKQSAGGLAVALRDATEARETLWFGWSGRETRVAPGGRAKLQRLGDRLTLATMDLSQAQYRGFYVGFSNTMLWPLFHGRTGLGIFDRHEFGIYREVNTRFAEVLKPLLTPDDTIWVHDYQLIMVGQALRAADVGNRVGFFLHIPFPPPGLYDLLPQGRTLLESFACYDLVGTQTQEDADNLNACLTKAGLEAKARAFAIGIDPEEFAAAALSSIGSDEMKRMDESLGNRALILGVDRLDYTKGLPERFRGYAKLLSDFPEHRNQVTFLQVAPVSRGDVAQYRTLRRELDGLAGRINGEHAEFDWVPLRYLTTSIDRDTLAGFHRRARVGLVTPLRDGMNLVAKEYVAAQDANDPGALVLSRFAGAASAMTGAVLVNPYDPDEIAEGLHAALIMSGDERRSRWLTMCEAVNSSTAAIWARDFLAALGE